MKLTEQAARVESRPIQRLICAPSMAIAIVLAMSAQPVLASGSYGGPSATSSYSDRAEVKPDPQLDRYARGKAIFTKHITCGTCVYAGRAKDATDARALRDELATPATKIKLHPEDRDALTAYLNERFDLAKV